MPRKTGTEGAGLAKVIKRALGFSEHPALLLEDVSVSEVAALLFRGSPTGQVVVDIEAAIRVGGPRFTGRLVLDAVRDDVIEAMAAGQKFTLVVTEVGHHPELGPLLHGQGGFNFLNDPTIVAEFRELAGLCPEAALLAELMSSRSLPEASPRDPGTQRRRPLG